jgi:hypothetical protein
MVTASRNFLLVTNFAGAAMQACRFFNPANSAVARAAAGPDSLTDFFWLEA